MSSNVIIIISNINWFINFIVIYISYLPIIYIINIIFIIIINLIITEYLFKWTKYIPI